MFELVEKNRELFITVFMVGLLSFLLSYLLYVVLNVSSDIQTHAEVIANMVNGTVGIQPNFLYYLIVYICSGFSTDINTLTLASLVVLSVAKAASFYISVLIMHSFLNKGKPLHQAKVPTSWIYTCCLMMLIIWSIPTRVFSGWYYLGQFPPNIWHNSTTMFLMPIALALFWLSYKQIVSPNNKQLAWVTGLSLASCFIKPTFFVALAPVYFVCSYFYRKSFRQFVVSQIPIIAGLLSVLSIYVLIYFLNIGTLYEGESSVGIEFFKGWQALISLKEIPLAMLGSVAFPLLVLVYAIYKGKYRAPLFWYGLGIGIICFLMFALLKEVGPRYWYANFIWQLIVANHIAFFLAIMFVLKQWFQGNQSGSKRPALKILTSAFALHVLAGVVYIVKIIVTHDYL